MTNPVRDLSLAALMVTVVLWASAFVGIRDLGTTFSPGALSLGRLIVGAIALSLIALPKHDVLPRGRPLGLIVAYGVLWFGAYNVLLNAGERYLDAGTSALVINIGPILIALFAGVLLKEGFPKPLIIGTMVAFAGVALIALSTDQDSTAVATASTTGVLLCVAAAVVYSIGVLCQKPALRTVPAVQAVWLGCIVGMVVCLPYAPSLLDQMNAASTKDLLVLIYLGIFPTAIGFSTWSYALKRLDAGKVAATTYLVPALTTVIAWILLDEVPAALAFIGGAMCLIGVAITRVRRRRAPVFTSESDQPIS